MKSISGDTFRTECDGSPFSIVCNPLQSYDIPQYTFEDGRIAVTV